MAIKRRYKQYFEAASQFCNKSHHARFHHGSVLVYKNTIIGGGSNAGFRHAEVSSILNQIVPKHKKFRSKLMIFVVRLNDRGHYMNSKPCLRCQEFMRNYGINEVHYSDENNNFGCMKFHHYDENKFNSQRSFAFNSQKSVYS